MAKNTTPALRTKMVTLGSITPNPANPRNNEKAVEHVAASINRFGFQQPIVINTDGMILAGHTRYLAAQALDLAKVPVVVFTGDNIEATAFGIADNRTAEFADWDDKALAAMLEELEREDALDGTGFSQDDLEKLLEDLEEKPKLGKDGRTHEPPEIPITQPGDLWNLGKHRVMCGDSTDAAIVKQLLGKNRPGIMVTDPPYGVDYQPEWRNDVLDSACNTSELKNDDRVDWTAAWELFPGDVAYTWCASTQSPSLAGQLEKAGFERRSLIIWVKPSFAVSRGHYHWRHEVCWYAVKKGRTASWGGDRKQNTVWEIDLVPRDDDKTEHSTQKPLECMERPILNHKHKGVYDPFLGSGTTLIACENQGRKCFGLELDPRFVDVIVTRWERITGKQATLDGTDQTFTEVAAERGHSDG
jgi:DNA modification methylase